MSVCVCTHTRDQHSYERNKEADPEFEPPDCTVDGCDCTGFETPTQRRARRREAFCARGPRYARRVWLLDADPFAVACELVDILARLDGLAETVDRLDQKDRRWKAKR